MADEDLGSYERRYSDDYWQTKKDPDITEDRDFIEKKRAEEKNQADHDKLVEALRDTKPSALNNPLQLFGGGPPQFPVRTEDQPRGTDFNQGKVKQNIIGPQFPPDAAAIAAAAAAGGIALNCSFLMKDASESSGGTTTYKVLIMDGKINGNFPSGMGFGNFVLTIPSTGLTYFIIAGVTFDPTTLLENSFFFEPPRLAADVPESRIEDATHGFLYWQIGFVYFTGVAPNQKLVIWQTWLGDINFAFSYGALNGTRGLLPIHTNPGWLDTEGIA